MLECVRDGEKLLLRGEATVFDLEALCVALREASSGRAIVDLSELSSIDGSAAQLLLSYSKETKTRMIPPSRQIKAQLDRIGFARFLFD